MRELKVIRAPHLNRLKADVDRNLKHYSNSEQWVSDYFGVEVWEQLSSMNYAPFELRLPEHRNFHDLENVETLYTALDFLTPQQASDERLWVYLTHTRYWDYMRARWPVEGKANPVLFVRERYFFMSNRSRAIVRNGLARLWWYGYVSNDPDRKNTFELTARLLSTLDVTQSIMERSVSNIPALTHEILAELQEQHDAGSPFDKRLQFRELMRHLNALGGVSILDVLEPMEIRAIIKEKIVEIRSSA